MKNPFSNNFTPEQRTQRMILPAGTYAAGIIGAKADDKQLTIQLEITEGEYTGFFKKDFDSQNGGFRAPKYRGVYILRFPDGKSQQGDQFREREARGAAWAVEQSNPGYHWAWETLERDLKGKAIGINVREREWAMQSDDGTWRTGVTTEIGALEDINAVRNGTVKVMKKRELSNADRERMAQSDAAEPAGFTAVETE